MGASVHHHDRVNSRVIPNDHLGGGSLVWTERDGGRNVGLFYRDLEGILVPLQLTGALDFIFFVLALYFGIVNHISRIF